MPPKIAVITGPTASGKTALGVALPETLHGDVVDIHTEDLYAHFRATGKLCQTEAVNVSDYIA